MRLHFTAATLAVFVLTLISARPAYGEPQMSSQRQAAILGRVLAYDRGMKERAGDSVVVAVLYRMGNPGSETCSNQMFEGFRSVERFVLHGLPFKVIRLTYDAGGVWRDTLRSDGVDAMYVCDGLDEELDTIASTARQRKITTMGAREEFVTRALAIGVFASDDKPVILINYAVSQEQGAVFGSELMRVATVINHPH
ncbi:MAG: YfiR/HmsC family protein [Myxococcota bacterium]